MLFMGTKSNPVENSYDQFMQKHGGCTNAFTDNDCTVYYFEVSRGKLAEGLERFGQFFYEPLLPNEGGERELHAVESEFQLHKSEDSVRLEQLRAHTSGGPPSPPPPPPSSSSSSSSHPSPPPPPPSTLPTALVGAIFPPSRTSPLPLAST